MYINQEYLQKNKQYIFKMLTLNIRIAFIYIQKTKSNILIYVKRVIRFFSVFQF